MWGILLHRGHDEGGFLGECFLVVVGLVDEGVEVV